jgi:hypothetical protein
MIMHGELNVSTDGKSSGCARLDHFYIFLPFLCMSGKAHLHALLLAYGALRNKTQHRYASPGVFCGREMV